MTATGRTSRFLCDGATAASRAAERLVLQSLARASGCPWVLTSSAAWWAWSGCETLSSLSAIRVVTTDCGDGKL